ncbi:MAG: insulinase family protein [Deltaproteobacteria bacterium]|nr:insulinase family protein [Deltaproteobacteria bacterium]
MTHQKTILSNGIRIVSDHVPHVPSISLGIWVNAGSREETREENGISHFIEHMIFKGTRHRSPLQIAKELDAIGGLSNAFTGKETTCFHARILEKDFGKLVDILSDIFLNSTFSPEDLELERQVIFREINMVEDCPDDHVHELFSRFFWSNHAIGMPIMGTGQTVAGIRRENLLDYIGRFYVPDRILVAAAGNVSHQRLVSAFRPVLEPLEGEGPQPLDTVPKANAGSRAYVKDLEQVQICLGGEAPGLTGDRRFASAVFNTILGGNMSSRLFQEIREKRALAYGVYSFLSAYRDTGLLGVYTATDPGNVNAVLETIWSEIASIAKGGVSDTEVAEAKDHVTGGISLSSESMDGLMMRLARNEFVFGKYVGLEEIIANIERVTTEEVIRAAADIFQNGRNSLVTLGPFDESDLAEEGFPFHTCEPGISADRIGEMSSICNQ